MSKVRGQARAQLASKVALAISFLALSPLSVYAATIPCTPDQSAKAKAALSKAKEMAGMAAQAIRDADSDSLAKLTDWLGVVNSAESEEVRKRYLSIETNIAKATFVCDNLTDVNPKRNVYARVLPIGTMQITLGSLFFGAPDDGFDSKAGTLVHEVSHFVLIGVGTGDVNGQNEKVYGTSKVLALAKKSPGEAQRVADAYEYFAESVYFKHATP